MTAALRREALQRSELLQDELRVVAEKETQSPLVAFSTCRSVETIASAITKKQLPQLATSS